ncbi:hypothetical protein GOBAR_AA19899 [Gossypium barbadense]|uniref:Uncharacterized protein n=1 Tax=Gossypium barbadense TaxID=3634 RepID=A0A2P5XBR5_GOSBA|nr:hypothetical protein GOBAR_AA19899 [Gossypium barbadense]
MPLKMHNMTVQLFRRLFFLFWRVNSKDSFEKRLEIQSKRHDQLRDIEASHIAKLIDNGDLATGKVKNQISSSPKTLLKGVKKFKEHGWDPLFKKVKLFCKDHEIEVSNLSALYKVGQEMNSHFNDEIMKLFVLSYVLDPSDNYKAFWVEDIYKLMNDFYLDDFTKQEKLHMKIQLEHFQLDAHQSTELQKASTVAELCQVLAKTTMKIVKTRLRNKMEDNILSTYLVAYIKKEIAREFLTDSIIDKFDLMKKRMVQFRMPSIEKWTKVKFF